MESTVGSKFLDVVYDYHIVGYVLFVHIFLAINDLCLHYCDDEIPPHPVLAMSDLWIKYFVTII